MKKCLLFFCWFFVSCILVSAAEPNQSPKIVEFDSGKLHIKAFLWEPQGSGLHPALLFNHASGDQDAQHTAGILITEAAEMLAPVFVKHGYAFLFPFRRGQGLSADQAPFMQDLLRKEEEAHGKEARQQLQDHELLPVHLQDVMAALSFLKQVHGIDPHRIAIAGHSFGGQLALLAAAKDPAVRAVVTFGAAARSWDLSFEVRRQLLAAMKDEHGAILLIHAANDFGTSPGKELSAELDRLHKPHVLKIYPEVGKTTTEGHNLLYLAIPAWKNDVLRFLDQHNR